MPRQKQPPRLYPRSEQRDKDGRVVKAASWIILDGGRQFGTGCGLSDIEGAQQALAAYIGKKYTVAASSGPRPTTEIPVADVLTKYARDKMPNYANPDECRRKLKRLASFFTQNVLANINGDLCRSYIEQSSTETVARGDLEVLRAAINYHRKEGLHDRIVSVVMPARPPSRERWLTPTEIAKLIRAAWRYQEVQHGHATNRWPRRHIARFLLIALYTGSRANVVMQASFVKEPGRPFIDLNTGMFYRRPEEAAETRKRRPTITVPDRLLAHMRRWARMGFKYAVEVNGKPVKRVQIGFRNAVADAGLGKDVTPHILRHTAATWLMLNGTDIWQAAGFLGMSVKTLQNVYGHHHPSHMEQARNAIARRRFPSTFRQRLA